MNKLKYILVFVAIFAAANAKNGDILFNSNMNNADKIIKKLNVKFNYPVHFTDTTFDDEIRGYARDAIRAITEFNATVYSLDRRFIAAGNPVEQYFNNFYGRVTTIVNVLEIKGTPTPKHIRDTVQDIVAELKIIGPEALKCRRVKHNFGQGVNKLICTIAKISKNIVNSFYEHADRRDSGMLGNMGMPGEESSHFVQQGERNSHFVQHGEGNSHILQHGEGTSQFVQHIGGNSHFAQHGGETSHFVQHGGESSHYVQHGGGGSYPLLGKGRSHSGSG